MTQQIYPSPQQYNPSPTKIKISDPPPAKTFLNFLSPLPQAGGGGGERGVHAKSQVFILLHMHLPN